MIQPPYTTGTATVTVGSAVVTGTTTAWTLGLVSGGLFTRQGLAVPIVSVESNTSLTLAYPWPGASGTGAYAIDLGRADAASAIVANRRLADLLAGIQGPFVEFRTSPDGLWVQFRNVGVDDPWTNLIPVASLPRGLQGLKGDTGDASSATTITAAQGISWGVSRQPTQSDWNAVTSGGVYMAQNMANAPGGNPTWHYVIVQRHDENHVSQTANNLFSGETFQRNKVGGTWQAWASVYTTRNLALPTQAQAESGTLATAGLWSPQRDAQAIAALETKGVALSGSQGGVTVGASDVALAPADSTASGPTAFGVANLSVEGSATVIVRARVDIFRIADGARIYVGPSIAFVHQANALERLIVPFAYSGLTKGLAYRARAFCSADTGSVSVSSVIHGINA